jgi:hypothetical protein
MALIPDNVPTREDDADILGRFNIAQDGPVPTGAQLAYQAEVRHAIATVALDLNRDVADSPAKSNALRKLEEALMWAGKAIFA